MEHGIITSVNYNEGVVSCHVQAIRVNTEYRDVPVMKPYAGMIRLPKPGQKAVMDVLDDGTRFITGYLAREDSYPNSLSNGEMTIQLDDSTEVTLTENANGNWDLDLSASGNLSVHAEGTVEVTGTTDVKIDGIDFDQHTHDYGDTTIADTGDGSGSSSTTTETTDPPQ